EKRVESGKLSTVRRARRIIASAWLVCQLAAVAAAPLSLCCTTAPVTGAAKKCCPGLKPGDVCPMHHVVEGDDDATCAMRSACGHIDPSLLALSAGLGVLTHSSTALPAGDAWTFVAAPVRSAVARAERPDAPPPRLTQDAAKRILHG